MKSIKCEPFIGSKSISKELIENKKLKEYKAYILFETEDILVLYIELTANQVIPPDRHGVYEVVFCLEGTAIYNIDGIDINLEKDNYIKIEPFILHNCTAGDEGIRIIAMLTRNQYFGKFI